MANVDIRVGKKDAAFFAANPTLVLKNGQLIYNEDTGDLFIGDGVTQLNALVAINGASSSYTFENGLTDTLGTVRLGGSLNQDTTINGGDTRSLLLGNSVGNNNLRRFTVNANLSATINSPSVNLAQQTPDSILTLDNAGDIQGVTLGASQSIRRNAANNAFEAYTPSIPKIGVSIGYLTVTSLADSTTYYFGALNNINALTSDGTNGRSLVAPINGFVTQLDFIFGCSNVITTENMTIEVHNKTQATSTTITSTFSTTGQAARSYDGFSLAVNVGDTLGLRLITPNFVTNPISTTITGMLFFTY